MITMSNLLYYNTRSCYRRALKAICKDGKKSTNEDRLYGLCEILWVNLVLECRT